jgi:hypothetical protein
MDRTGVQDEAPASCADRSHELWCAADGPLATVRGKERATISGATMGTCRCEVLNVMSGDVARDYARVHLREVRKDGMGRRVHLCDDAGVEWVEEREPGGYADDATVLRRLTR